MISNSGRQWRQLLCKITIWVTGTVSEGTRILLVWTLVPEGKAAQLLELGGQEFNINDIICHDNPKGLGRQVQLPL